VKGQVGMNDPAQSGPAYRSSPATPHLTGTVVDVAFRGRGYEHAVDIPGHGRLAGVPGSGRADRGRRVGLRLEAAGCHLFPAPGICAVPGAGAAAAAQSRPP
jgi:iron(III) transport system ATP-binding protein